MRRYLVTMMTPVLLAGAGCGGEECGDELCDPIASSEQSIASDPVIYKEPLPPTPGEVPNGMSPGCDLRALCGECDSAMKLLSTHAFTVSPASYPGGAVAWSFTLTTLASKAKTKCKAFESCKTDCTGCTLAMVGCVLSFGIGCVPSMLSACMGCDFGQADVSLGSCYPPGSIPNTPLPPPGNVSTVTPVVSPKNPPVSSVTSAMN